MRRKQAISYKTITETHTQTAKLIEHALHKLTVILQNPSQNTFIAHAHTNSDHEIRSDHYSDDSVFGFFLSLRLSCFFLFSGCGGITLMVTLFHVQP